MTIDHCGEVKSAREVGIVLPHWAEKICLPLVFPLQFCIACPLALLMRGCSDLFLISIPILNHSQGEAGSGRGTTGPKARAPWHRGWKEVVLLEEGCPATSDRHVQVQPSSLHGTLAAINPGLQSRALSHLATRHKGQGNEAHRETQKAALVCPST